MAKRDAASVPGVDQGPEGTAGQLPGVRNAEDFAQAGIDMDKPPPLDNVQAHRGTLAQRPAGALRTRRRGGFHAAILHVPSVVRPVHCQQFPFQKQLLFPTLLKNVAQPNRFCKHWKAY
jgi:hypothetical protein